MIPNFTPLKPYEPNWPHGYCTRDGQPARVICTDAKSELPIVALVRDGESDWLQVYRTDGTYSPFKGERSGDLMCAAPPERELIEAWLMLDRYDDLAYAGKDMADGPACADRADKEAPEFAPHRTVLLREVRS